MRRITMRSGRTWPWAKTRRWAGQFSGPVALSPSRSCPGSTTITSGYDFRKGQVIAAGLMGLIGYFLSYRAIFLVAAALVVPLLFALARIRPSDIHFGRACGVPDHHGPNTPPRAQHWNVWTNRNLLIFAACLFLFQLANASVLPLAGESLVYGKVAYSS